MIACDKCPEWFHGDCIGIVPREADNILHYYCEPCRKKYNLKIVYKRPPDDVLEPRKSVEKPTKKIVPPPKKSRLLSNSSSDDDDDDYRSVGKKSSHKDDSSSAAESEDSHVSTPSTSSSTSTASSSEESDSFATASVVSSRAGPQRTSQTAGATKRGRGGGGVKRKMPGQGGGPLGQTSSSSNAARHQEVIPYLSGESEEEDSNQQLQRRPAPLDTFTAKAKQTAVARNCGVCVACERRDDCGKCDVCTGTCPSNKRTCRLRICVNPIEEKPPQPVGQWQSDGMSPMDTLRSPTGMDSSSSVLSRSVTGRSTATTSTARHPQSQKERPRGGTAGRRGPLKPSIPTRKISAKKPRGRGGAAGVSRGGVSAVHISSPLPPSSGTRGSGKVVPSAITPPMQCWGPGCVEPARSGSKYCSDSCGVKLATLRLEQLLPSRVESWANAPSIRQHEDEVKMKKLDADLKALFADLLQKENDIKTLNAVVEKVRHMRAFDEKSQLHDPVETDSGEQVFCVTCGSEVNVKHCLRHMEKCFQKMENNSVFYASTREQPIGPPLFCDVYDSQAKAYCKRLKALCEHTKDPKLPSDALCGYPLVKNVFQPTGGHCQVLRRKCNRHCGWERTKRAIIDMQRYHTINRMQELMVQLKIVKQRIERRGHVLGLLLNETTKTDAEVNFTLYENEFGLTCLAIKVLHLYFICNQKYNKEENPDHFFVKPLQDLLQDVKFSKHLAELRTVSNTLKESQETRQRLMNLVHREPFLRCFCAYLTHLINLETDIQERDQACVNTIRLLFIAWNVSDNSHESCCRLVTFEAHSLCLALMARIQKQYASLGPRLPHNIYILVLASVGILHNICMQVPLIRSAYRAKDAVRLLGTMAKCAEEVGEEYNNLRCSSVLLLSFLVTERENERVHGKSDITKQLVSILEDSLVSPEFFSKSWGFHASELLVGLKNMAGPDENKRRLIHSGLLKCLNRVLEIFEETGSSTADPVTNLETGVTHAMEAEAALELLWSLSIPQDCSILLQKERDLVARLGRLADTCNDSCCDSTTAIVPRSSAAQCPQVQHYASTVLQNLRRPLALVEPAAEQRTPNSEGHVMISYQHSTQTVMVRLKNRLVAMGYKVWMDVDYMKGSFVDAMATAVENASVVVMGLCQAYKNSPHCRQEALYAYIQRIPLIPVLLERDFVPDGWCGILCASVIHTPFLEECQFERSMQHLAKQLGTHGLLKHSNSLVHSNSTGSSASMPHTVIEVGRSGNQEMDHPKENFLPIPMLSHSLLSSSPSETGSYGCAMPTPSNLGDSINSSSVVSQDPSNISSFSSTKPTNYNQQSPSNFVPTPRGLPHQISVQSDFSLTSSSFLSHQAFFDMEDLSSNNTNNSKHPALPLSATILESLHQMSSRSSAAVQGHRNTQPQQMSYGLSSHQALPSPPQQSRASLSCSHSGSLPPVSQWNVEDVLHWLSAEDLGELTPLMMEWTGPLVEEFALMLLHAPTYFYRVTKEEWHLSLVVQLKLCKALRRLKLSKPS